MTEAKRVEPWVAALGRIPSGLFIVTACHRGQRTGMLASWIQQCSFSPPLISIAVRHERPMTTWLAEGCPFVVNILDETQTDMLAHFGRGFAPDQDAFGELSVETCASGIILEEALACLECQIVGSLSAGDHAVFAAQILGGRMLGDGRPMVHVRKNGLHY